MIHHIDEAYPDKHFTFKVNARRARKNYPLESMEINAQLGERILNAFPETRVDVHKPEVVINVEIRNQINVYSTVIPGPGGMPVGTNGKAMLLLSGGIDSPVAGYMIAKRGVTIDATYFHAPPIPQSVQNRRLWILQRSLQNIPDRSTCMLSTLRISSFISTSSVRMRS